MSNVKFRVGDVVRNDGSIIPEWRGRTGTVIVTNSPLTGRIDVDSDEGPMNGATPSSFTLVTPKLEVGDRIKYRDVETVVTRIESPEWSSFPLIYAHFSDPNHETWVRPDKLERISLGEDAEPQVAREPRIGDRVRVLSEYHDNPGYCAGYEGYVVDIDPVKKDIYPYRVQFDAGDEDWVFSVQLIETPSAEVPEGYVKADTVYRLAERLAEEQEWCNPGRQATFAALASIGVTAPVKKQKLSLTFELDISGRDPMGDTFTEAKEHLESLGVPASVIDKLATAEILEA